MVCFMENPMKMDENWGYPHDLGNLHIILLVISPSYSQSIPNTLFALGSFKP